ncbi:NAD(P)/FAD-dependent oxidoreductase [Tardiphaga sp.]|uniref:FAD-dependent oxidoreductase n=1 Tax=Tardiphaga sp. TaxID=1926292 RepID=UPI002612B13F|nr:NAD(P)/FAD-dependent oxidoreductase [Tardiphaga sp.]MDB5618337.1 monooxygenase, FAD-binding protein [Tardiphaga sp.]
MRYADIAVVGGGLAGSTAAAMLGRAGVSAVMIDPHAKYPPDLRSEKISTNQLELLRKTGLVDAALRAGRHDRQIWTARFGYLIDKKPSEQFGILYDTMVNAIRGEIPTNVDTIEAKVTEISTGPGRQTLTLSTGEQISARLVILSSGLNIGLLHQLGIDRQVISKCHSITVGFDIAPVGRPAFDFPALTYFSERPSDRSAYLTLFPVPEGMRANLFVYRDMEDPWLREMRDAPEDALHRLYPRLRTFTGEFRITNKLRIRPADLYVSTGHRQAGVVLVGDAFSTSCPSAGTGTDKVFTDVERLCNAYIPAWLATDGMGADKIGAFYDDPAKVACDAWSNATAYHFRSVSIGESLPWQARRWARFLGRRGQGLLRRLRAQVRGEAEAA